MGVATQFLWRMELIHHTISKDSTRVFPFIALLRKNVLVLLSKPVFLVFTFLAAFAMPLITTMALYSLGGPDLKVQASDLKSSYSMELPSDYAIFYTPDTEKPKLVMEALTANYPSSYVKGFGDETLLIKEFISVYDSLNLDVVEFAGIFFDGESVTANSSSTSYQIWRQGSFDGQESKKKMSLFYPALQFQLDRVLVQSATGKSSLSMYVLLAFSLGMQMFSSCKCSVHD